MEPQIPSLDFWHLSEEPKCPRFPEMSSLCWWNGNSGPRYVTRARTQFHLITHVVFGLRWGLFLPCIAHNTCSLATVWNAVAYNEEGRGWGEPSLFTSRALRKVAVETGLRSVCRRRPCNGTLTHLLCSPHLQPAQRRGAASVHEGRKMASSPHTHLWGAANQSTRLPALQPSPIHSTNRCSWAENERKR